MLACLNTNLQQLSHDKHDAIELFAVQLAATAMKTIFVNYFRFYPHSTTFCPALRHNSIL